METLKNRRFAIFQAWQRTGRVSLTHPCYSDARKSLAGRAIRLDRCWQRMVRLTGHFATAAETVTICADWGDGHRTETTIAVR